jgi:hypothetical protein
LSRCHLCAPVVPSPMHGCNWIVPHLLLQSGTTFTANTVPIANGTGGALFLRGGNGGSYNISGCSFTSNTLVNALNTLGGAGR